MLAEQKSKAKSTEIQISQELLYHQKVILNLLRKSLSRFAKIYRSAVEPEEFPVKKEDYLTTQLQRFLNKKIKGYLFEPQAQCGPDLQVIVFKTFSLHETPIFVIETKRLRKKSRRDYVKGKTGGIERFKKQKHDKTFDTAAMLGYVEENDFSHWYGKVNGWIDDLIPTAGKGLKWENQDKLKKVKVTDIGEYSSRHSRISKDPITLYHFWINLQTFS